MPPEGFEPPSLVPKTSVLSVELQGPKKRQADISPQGLKTLLFSLANQID